jgi:hypothetical protein
MKGLHKIKTARIYAVKQTKSNTLVKPFMKHYSFWRAWIFQVIAAAVAWNLIVAVSAVLGHLIGVRFWPLVMIWLWGGLLVVLLKPVKVALPAVDRVNVLTMLLMLRQAAQWPKYFL